MNILAIDPSLHKTGYAIFSDTELEYAGTIFVKGKDIYQSVSIQLANFLRRIAPFYHQDKKFSIIIEAQSNWSTLKGQAGKDSGNIQKLYFLTGCIVGNMINSASYVDAIYTIPPEKWKGNVPKKIMIQRCLKYIGDKSYDKHRLTDDCCEAVLLGKWLIQNTEKADVIFSRNKPYNLRLETEIEIE